MPEQHSTENCLPVLRLRVPDCTVLKSCYLSFLDSGGLYVCGHQGWPLGQPLLLIMHLDEPQMRFVIHARVFLLTPARKQGRRTPGTGLKFVDNDGGLKTRFAKLLAGVEARDARVMSLFS